MAASLGRAEQAVQTGVRYNPGQEMWTGGGPARGPAMVPSQDAAVDALAGSHSDSWIPGTQELQFCLEPDHPPNVKNNPSLTSPAACVELYQTLYESGRKLRGRGRPVQRGLLRDV